MLYNIGLKNVILEIKVQNFWFLKPMVFVILALFFRK